MKQIRTIKEFVKEFGTMYSEIYETEAAGEDYPGARLATWAFDEFGKTDAGRDLINAYIEEAQDLITSDREAAAFMLTLDRFGLI